MLVAPSRLIASSQMIASSQTVLDIVHWTVSCQESRLAGLK
jgi:hypothetical protein